MLKPPTPGLHRLHNKLKDVAKVTLTVGPYDELEVSEDIAAQLNATGQFADGPAPGWPDEWNPPAEAAAEAADDEQPAPKKTRAKKQAKAAD